MRNPNKRRINLILITTLLTSFFGFAAPGAQAAALSESQAVVDVVSAVRVDVDQDGMVAVRYADLVDAGADPAAANPATFRLTFMGSEVASEVTGAADNSFDTGDEIRFYGKARDSKYGNANSYRLSWGQANGIRMMQRDASPSGAATPGAFADTVHLEQDKRYASNLPMQPDADHWFMDNWRLRVYTPYNIFRYYFQDLAPAASGAATLKIALQGQTQDWYIDPDHHVRLYVNGTSIGDLLFDGTAAFVGELTFDNSLLVAGQNEITFEALDDLGATTASRGYTNWLELTYQRQYAGSDAGQHLAIEQAGAWQVEVAGFSAGAPALYDVTHPLEVVRLTGGQMTGGSLVFGATTTGATRYWVGSESSLPGPAAVTVDQPSNLRSGANGADYILITHSAFSAQAQQLAAYRAGQGLRTALVDVQDVYDEFNGGMMSAEAIRDFLSYAYNNWQAPAPTYVVLLGDGHYDFKGNLNTGTPVFIPPYLALIDLNVGEVPTDNRFVEFSGDRLPEMQIGRLPASNVSQAQAMVDKIIAYESTQPSADWLDDITLVADAADITSGDFPALSDQILPMVPAYYNVERIYYKTTPGYDTAQAVRTGIMNAINQGRFAVSYIGHGSLNAWHGSLFTANDVANLANGNKLPIVTTFGCETGYFVDPYYPALAERLASEPGKGAVATFAATGKGTAVGQQWLSLGFYDAIFQQGVSRIGEAVVFAKQYLAINDSRWPELLDTFHLFGDPALIIQRPAADLSIQLTASPESPAPGSQVTLEIQYSNQGLMAAGNTVIDLILPQELTLADSALLTSKALPGGQQSWNLGNLAAGTDGIITVTATLDSNLQGGELLISRAEGSTNSNDPDLINNSDTAELIVAVSPKATVAGMAFIDDNGDGIRNSGENSGASGTTVVLWNAAGQMVNSAVVGNDGVYSFGDLDAGTYTIQAEPAGGLVATGSLNQQLILNEGDSATVDFGFLTTTAVIFTAFDGQAVNGQVLLSWMVQDETGIDGYQVWRSESPDGVRQIISLQPIATDGLPGGAFYQFEDAVVQVGATYWYWVEALGLNEIQGPISLTVDGVANGGGFRTFMPTASVG